MSNIFDDIKKNPKYNSNNSASWFRQNVTDAFRNLGQQQFMEKNKMRQTTKVSPGQMIFFGYDPKYKEELPFYDKFPLLLPFYIDSTHFMGLNLHYLPPPKRLIILDKLVQTAVDKTLPDKMKLKLSWSLLTSLSENKLVKYSVKKYLYGHVKTNFINVPTSDWPLAIWLPMARFEKANQQEVWKGLK